MSDLKSILASSKARADKLIKWQIFQNGKN